MREKRENRLFGVLTELIGGIVGRGRIIYYSNGFVPVANKTKKVLENKDPGHGLSV